MPINALGSIQILGPLAATLWLFAGKAIWLPHGATCHLPVLSMIEARPAWARSQYQAVLDQGPVTAWALWVAARYADHIPLWICTRLNKSWTQLCERAGWPAGLQVSEWLVLSGLAGIAGSVTGAAFFGVSGMIGGWGAMLIVPLMLRRRWHAARQAAETALPRWLELMVLLGDAGQPVAQSLFLAASGVEGVLARWLGELEQRCRSGRDLVEELEQLAARTGIDLFGSLSETISQTRKFGTRIVPHLERLADRQRTHQLHEAEERAQAAPVAILPALMLIFATIMALLMAPFAGAMG